MPDIKRKILTTSKPIRFVVTEPCEFEIHTRLLAHRRTVRHVIEAPMAVQIVHPIPTTLESGSSTPGHDGMTPRAESAPDHARPES